MIPREVNEWSTFRLFGSVLPRAMGWAVIGGVCGALFDWSDLDMFKYRTEHSVWHHPYSLHVFGMVLGFALVMRVQIAYARFWEAATQLTQVP